MSRSKKVRLVGLRRAGASKTLRSNAIESNAEVRERAAFASGDERKESRRSTTDFRGEENW